MIEYSYDPPYNLWSGNRSDTLNKWKINYKGSIATASALPEKGDFKGDTYNVLEDGSNYMWNGTSWDKLDANVYVGATATTNGIRGLVPPATTAQMYSLLTGIGTWQSAEDLGLALDDEVVHLTGDETIEGLKTFQNNHLGISSQIIVKSTDIVKGTASFDHNTGIVFADSTDNDPDAAGRLASVVYHAPNSENSDYYAHLRCNNYYGSGDSVLRVGYDGDNIPYSTAPATSNERTNSTDIVTRGYMEASEWNWQKTKKDALVQFKPVPESDLEPVVDFMFTETPPVEGEKGPDNPSTISGVSSATVTHCETEGESSTDYIISFGDTYYGGSLDVATGVMTVTHKKVIINENCTFFWPSSSSYNSDSHVYIVVTISSLPASSFQYLKSKSSCDSLSFSTETISNNSCILTTSSERQYVTYKQFGIILLRSTIGVSSSATKEEIEAAAKVWFMAHPASLILYFDNSDLWSSVQLTPTQIRSLSALDKYEPRINTVYSDQEAVQVGYQRYFNESRLAALEARIEALEASQS